jgi:hypothetical protein
MKLAGQKDIIGFGRNAEEAARHHATQALRAVEYNGEEARSMLGVTTEAIADAMVHLIEYASDLARAKRVCMPLCNVCALRGARGNWMDPHAETCPLRLATFFRRALYAWLHGDLKKGATRIAFWNGALEQEGLVAFVAGFGCADINPEHVDAVLASQEPRWARRALLEAREAWRVATDETPAPPAGMANMLYENALLKAEVAALRDSRVWEKDVGASGARDVAELLGNCVVVIERATADGDLDALLLHGREQIGLGGCTLARFP